MIAEEAPYNGEESEQRDFVTEAMTNTVSNGTTEDNSGLELFRQPDRQPENLKLKSTYPQIRVQLSESLPFHTKILMLDSEKSTKNIRPRSTIDQVILNLNAIMVL